MYVTMARFQRTASDGPKTKQSPKNTNVAMEAHSINPKNTTLNNSVPLSGKPSFVSIVHGSTNTKGETSSSVKVRFISLSAHDLISVDGSYRVLLVQLKEVLDFVDNDLTDGLQDIIKYLIEDKEAEGDNMSSDKNSNVNFAACHEPKEDTNDSQLHPTKEEGPSDLSYPPGFEHLKRLIIVIPNKLDPPILGQTRVIGDMNEVHDEHESYGSIFSRSEAETFNTFINNACLIDLLMGGRLFTWMNKVGMKLSKLDRFFFSEDVIGTLPDIGVIALDRLDDVITKKGQNIDGNKLLSYEKLKQRIKDGSASPKDGETRIKLLQESDNLEKLDAMDTVQKARINGISKDVVSLDEINAVVWDCGSDKAVGSDGFSFSFVKRYWELLYIGFGLKWWTWIKAWPESSRISILVNGSHAYEFFIKRGLRQCDPLSPFLFILIMEGLHIALSDVVRSGLIRGIHIGNPDVMYFIWPRVSTLKANLLSIGGCLTLIKSFLGSLGLYYLSIFKIPKTVLKNLECVAWAIRGFDHQGCKTNGLLEKIFGSSNYLHSSGILLVDSLRLKVGCGTLVRFWNWLGDPPLSLWYNRLYRLEQDKDCLIRDRISIVQWYSNWSRFDLGVRNSAYLIDMLAEIGHVVIDSDEDACFLSLANDGAFSVC
ncbi:RNA-directed DNA polymerase, eukaryota, reverse transcriptase zinc-binding domain protein [Tanacetum coccineum]|uniref:RNA-directed DNA polymerase, eukaryota, reverse transcriptase zinc-binding domain protein n=1 Tax=Tanacetum coccineum TaxID=301880 RepID=A0ABQ5AF13_9ASTR